ncbi:MAG: Erv1/Alr family FAD-linked sulfhydryl oxidase [Nitrososphaerota archaeon]
MEISKSKDPKYIGPGTWSVIHRLAYHARTLDQQLRFIQVMKDICQWFPCESCREHCLKYIKENPMENYLNLMVKVNGEFLPIPMFLWTWEFHNNVNRKLSKEILSWKVACKIYSELECNDVCSKL